MSRRSVERDRDAGESKKTVWIALAANSVIALAKALGGLATGSAGMLAEAAHSVADTTNQGFLRISISLAEREPGPDRPFGHGQERFLWTFMAAIGMFLAGAIFAVAFGLYELLVHEGEDKMFGVSFAILGVAFIAEGISWIRAYRQTRKEAREADKGILEYARGSRDPNVKMVLFEDSVALIGIVVAALGIGLNLITGETYFDPIASILIGLLLISVAWWMARDAKHLLVGWAARPEERDALEKAIDSYDEVDEVDELLTMVLGPNALLVAARIDFTDDIDAERVEEVSSDIDRKLREVVPDVTEVFLDPTPR